MIIKDRTAAITTLNSQSSNLRRIALVSFATYRMAMNCGCNHVVPVSPPSECG